MYKSLKLVVLSSLLPYVEIIIASSYRWERQAAVMEPILPSALQSRTSLKINLDCSQDAKLTNRLTNQAHVAAVHLQRSPSESYTCIQF
jgi:hypothetical protein